MYTRDQGELFRKKIEENRIKIERIRKVRSVIVRKCPTCTRKSKWCNPCKCFDKTDK